MKNHKSFFVILMMTIQFSFAQNTLEKQNTLIPKATLAKERWEGYQQRLELQEKSLVKNLFFRNIGPTIMSGRVTDLAVDPKNTNHFYVAYASGSLWETKNNGISFEPLFDEQIVMTIGDIAVDWENNILYVGTGENNSSRSSYSGYGIFKSMDNGSSWEHLGLEETHHTGRILIHPKDPNILFVATLGHLYSENAERGLYKTIDGGKTWKKTLFINNRTGIVDIAVHPSNPDLMLAAAWEKDRKAWNFVESGIGSALYRSIDGGDSWKKIDKNSGFPNTEGTGRIGLTFAPSNPNILYAILDNQDRRDKDIKKQRDNLIDKNLLRNITPEDFLNLDNKKINQFLDEHRFPEKYNAVDIKKSIENKKITPKDLVTYTEDANSLLFDTPVKGAEMYRSEDGGKTWKKTHKDYIEDMIFTYGYYFGQVRVDPINPDVVYTMGVPLVKSEDGGKSWKSISKKNVHADHHALWINPNNSQHMIVGNDGGINISFDKGQTWTKCNSPAVGQFYSVNIDMDTPYNVYGGLQDNGVWKGSSKYEYSRAWHQDGRYLYQRLMGGDGMQVAIDTRTNDRVYTGYQFGNYFRINTTTNKRKYITPKHQLGESSFRWNWETPILLSSHNQDIVYFGSNYFHRSMNKGEYFETLSKDLTDGGKKGDVSYGTLTTLSESPLRFGLIYVGSDDGLIHVSKNAGNDWKKTSALLPKNYWVSQVFASHHQENRVYASLNGYRWDCFDALVYISEDYGETWQSIGADLPKEPVNVIKEDPENENILYVGTDHGVYVSLNKGKTFHSFKNGLSGAPVHDLVIHPREKDLVIATHGRSIYVADVLVLQQLSEEIISKKLHLFSLEDITHNPDWGSKRWTWGEVKNPTLEVPFFVNKNTPVTIQITYKDKVIISETVEADKGLNFADIALEVNEDYKKLLPKELKEEYKSGEDGMFYPLFGEYKIIVQTNESTQSTRFEIKKSKKRSTRQK